MKTFFLIILIVLCIPNLSHAQQDTARKVKIYKTWIPLLGAPSKLKGALYKIQDSSILISNSLLKSDYVKIEPSVTKFDFNAIDIIQLRRTNRVLKGLIIGTVAGAAIGAIIGYSMGSQDSPAGQINGVPLYWHFSAGENARTGVFIIGIPGAIIGALIGSIKKKIPIKGNYMNFAANRKLLEKYSIR